MMMIIGPRHAGGAKDLPSARCVARSHEGVFSGGRVSLESWSPGPKPLCHRHPAYPHPSGALWTPWTPTKGCSTKTNVALERHLGLEVEQVQALGVERQLELVVGAHAHVRVDARHHQG